MEKIKTNMTLKNSSPLPGDLPASGSNSAAPQDPEADPLHNLSELINLIETLRGEGGCPWDKKQTPSSLSVYLVEEVYELVEAIRSGNPTEICEEMGDVLFQILFIASIFSEKRAFDLNSALIMITEKMIRRHPHVFGTDTVDSVEEIKKRWHEIKMGEKPASERESVLDSVPVTLPALMRAYRISERAAKAGFDWSDIDGVKEKVVEEWSELNTELASKNKEHAALEFGDLLFSLVNYARFANIHPETALAGSVKKFERRFKYMEKRLSENGQSMNSVSMEKMDRLWNEAKKQLL